MQLVGVRVEMPTNSPIVLLRESEGQHRVLPIFIGPVEATAIAFAQNGVVTARPLTHDLLRDLLEEPRLALPAHLVHAQMAGLDPILHEAGGQHGHVEGVLVVVDGGRHLAPGQQPVALELP